MVAVTFDKKELAGGWPLYLFPGRRSSPADEEGGSAGWPARTNSFIYIKGAHHPGMDIHVHEFPARFIFFIHMLIQVQALQNTNMDPRDYII